MHRIILSSVACLALNKLSTLSHKRHDFREKVIENKICVLIFFTKIVLHIFHSKQNSARYYHKYRNIFMQSIRYSCQILTKLELVDIVLKNTQI
jgi:hypothetical protein